MAAIDVRYLSDFYGSQGPAREELQERAQGLRGDCGVPEPRQEIKTVAFHVGSSPRISHSVQRIIERYRSPSGSSSQ